VGEQQQRLGEQRGEGRHGEREDLPVLRGQEAAGATDSGSSFSHRGYCASSCPDTPSESAQFGQPSLSPWARESPVCAPPSPVGRFPIRRPGAAARQGTPSEERAFRRSYPQGYPPLWRITSV